MSVYKDTQIIDGQEVLIAIEVDQLPEMPEEYRNLRGGYEAGKIRDLFGGALKLSRNCAVRVVDDIKKMKKVTKPDEFQLQFAVKLDTEVGAMIAKSGAEAQLKITMTWKMDSEKRKEKNA